MTPRLCNHPKDKNDMFSKPKDKAKNDQPAAEAPSAAPADDVQKKTDKTSPNAEAKTAVEAAPVAPDTPPSPETPKAAAEAPKPSPETPELAALKDRYTRLLADFDNFRKRQTREREEWVKRANEDLLGDLLPVVDHLELALKKPPALSDAFVVGIKLVYDQLLSLLDRYGVTPIDAKGQPFDPSIHEALSQMNSATVPANVVIDQFRRGWRLSGRLLRPSQVIISSGAPAQEQAESESDSVSD